MLQKLAKNDFFVFIYKFIIYLSHKIMPSSEIFMTYSLF